jgi:hypothetical protein
MPAHPTGCKKLYCSLDNRASKYLAVFALFLRRSIVRTDSFNVLFLPGQEIVDLKAQFSQASRRSRFAAGKHGRR